MQKRINLSICRFDCGLEWAEGCTSSIIFARWRQCALMEGHVAVTCRITLNHPCTAAIRHIANYFDHLLSLDTPSYTVAQIAKRFEPSTVLWAFHTIQPSSFRKIILSAILSETLFELGDKAKRVISVHSVRRRKVAVALREYEYEQTVAIIHSWVHCQSVPVGIDLVTVCLRTCL